MAAMPGFLSKSVQIKKAAPAKYCDDAACLIGLAPEVGLEPTTLRLTAGCSTIELLRNKKRVSYQIERASVNIGTKFADVRRNAA